MENTHKAIVDSALASLFSEMESAGIEQNDVISAIRAAIKGKGGASSASASAARTYPGLCLTGIEIAKAFNMQENTLVCRVLNCLVRKYDDAPGVAVAFTDIASAIGEKAGRKGGAATPATLNDVAVAVKALSLSAMVARDKADDAGESFDWRFVTVGEKEGKKKSLSAKLIRRAKAD